MSYRTLISCSQLAGHLDDPNWAIVDCRFSLDNTERGRRAYLEGHVPGAVYAHLDEHLSGPIVPGKTGRHPLPEVQRFVETLSSWGISQGVQVVAYDDMAGAMAARLWWMLRWLGHDEVAVLNGGWQEWLKTDGRSQRGIEVRQRREFHPHARPDWVFTAEEVLARIQDPQWKIVDSRIGERFRGEVEPIDRVAGHIPGSVNAPHGENIAADGLFKSKESLQQRFERSLAETPPERTVFYCGSGVTAAHNLLAFAHAGLGDARLYAGSWSDWITDPGRPVAKGS